jgi:hypothetical protein
VATLSMHPWGECPLASPTFWNHQNHDCSQKDTRFKRRGGISLEDGVSCGSTIVSCGRQTENVKHNHEQELCCDKLWKVTVVNCEGFRKVGSERPRQSDAWSLGTRHVPNPSAEDPLPPYTASCLTFEQFSNYQVQS